MAKATVGDGGHVFEAPGKWWFVRARRDSIGFVFQSYDLLPGETALANVELSRVHNRLRSVPGTRGFAFLATAVASARAHPTGEVRS